MFHYITHWIDSQQLLSKNTKYPLKAQFTNISITQNATYIFQRRLFFDNRLQYS